MGGRVDDFRQTLDSSKAPGFLMLDLGDRPRSTSAVS